MTNRKNKLLFGVITAVIGVIFFLHSIGWGIPQLLQLGFLTNISLGLNFILAAALAQKV